MDKDNLQSFLKELTELTDKYGIYLGGEPFLYDEKDEILLRELNYERVDERGKGYHRL